jgi:hypothetical protein
MHSFHSYSILKMINYYVPALCGVTMKKVPFLGNFLLSYLILYRLSSETHKLDALTFILHFPDRRFTSDCNFSFASSKELAGIIVDCEPVTLPLYITEKFNSY